MTAKKTTKAAPEKKTGEVVVVMLQPMAGVGIDWPVGSEQSLSSDEADRLVAAGLAKIKG